MKNNTTRITVTVTKALRKRMEECMAFRGHRIVSEFIAVSIAGRCCEIETARLNAQKAPGLSSL
jgi:hypothetical protein